MPWKLTDGPIAAAETRGAAFCVSPPGPPPELLCKYQVSQEAGKELKALGSSFPMVFEHKGLPAGSPRARLTWKVAPTERKKGPACPRRALDSTLQDLPHLHPSTHLT